MSAPLRACRPETQDAATRSSSNEMSSGHISVASRARSRTAAPNAAGTRVQQFVIRRTPSRPVRECRCACCRSCSVIAASLTTTPPRSSRPRRPLPPRRSAPRRASGRHRSGMPRASAPRPHRSLAHPSPVAAAWCPPRESRRHSLTRICGSAQIAAATPGGIDGNDLAGRQRRACHDRVGEARLQNDDAATIALRGRHHEHHVRDSDGQTRRAAP